MALLLNQKILKYKGLRDKYFNSIKVTYSLIREESRRKEFIARCNKINQVYESFEDAQVELIGLNSQLDPKEDPVDTEGPSRECDTMYFQIQAALKEFATPPTLPTAPQSTVENRPKIPKINIEPFDGQIEKFSSFKSLYDTLIHHSSLSTIEKYSYLLSLLRGNALTSIKSLEFKEANYDLAYSKLCAEYSNPRRVAIFYLNKILNYKPLPVENSSTLRQFLDHFCVDVKAVCDLEINDLADFIFLHLALKYLPLETRRLFEQECINKSEIPLIGDLMVCVKGRLDILEMTSESKKANSAPITRSFIATSTSPKVSSPVLEGKSYITCSVCKSDHRINQCPKFLSMDYPQRHDAVRNAKLCFSCLGPHPRVKCKTTYSCRTCHDRGHHSLLHPPSKPEKPKQVLACNQPSQSANSVTLLGTASALVQCSSGFWHKIRLVIDPGSMLSFITSSLAQTLRLPQSPTPGQITGLGHTPVLTNQMGVNIQLAPIGSPVSTLFSINAVVIPNISSEIPHKPIPAEIARKFANMHLADYSIFQRPSKVDILLGAAHLNQILLPGEAIIPGEPSCWPTVFGNILIGKLPEETDVPHQSLFVQGHADPLLSEIKRFWEMEEVVEHKAISPEDEACEKHFKETHQRTESGKFIVRLPFKNNLPPDLGSTREAALRQFYLLEKRLDRNKDMKAMYHENLQGYIDQDQLAPASSQSPYILPHHAVIKQSSSHPLRIVFNASQISTTNKTLNQAMHVGPKLQHDVGDVILNYRLHAVALCADIRQMYRCIILHPEDRQYQHIFWRFSKDQPIQEWELKRLTFGFTPASYIAQKCLRTLAENERDRFPEASKILLNGCYVDDIVCSVPTVNAAKQLRHDLVALLELGGFVLKKFASSSPEVLCDIPEEDQEKSLMLPDTDTIKVLGLRWDPKADVFCYMINIKFASAVTKRSLLSNIASIFDINGYLTHLIIFLKIIIQKIWIVKGDWDDPLPSNLLENWNTFVRELPLLADIKIPRYISSSCAVLFHLIGFADASSAAMAAVVYLRVQCSDGKILINLLRAKSKVAPLKTISIPRLELCAAHLLVKVLSSLECFTKSVKIESTTCFTDSTTVLAWLQTPPYQLKTFVANRVAAIVEKVHPSQWRYVPTNVNPADLASRGLLPSQVVAQFDFWYHGPPFLLQEPTFWPKMPSTLVPRELPEMKPSVSLLTHEEKIGNSAIDLLERFSSLTKLKNVIAWIFRFKNNCLKRKVDRVYGPLSTSEINIAMIICVKITQQFYFSEVIKDLLLNKPHLGSLKTLSPFLSPAGLLMVGGRLKNSPLPESSKNPLLLPSKCHLAKLIIDYFHKYSLHGGVRIIQSLIQRQFWITGARTLIKQRVFACLQCYKLTASARPQYMGDLPTSRFAQGRCFINTAMDFAGPFMLKSGPRRNSPILKAYMVVFVCMATKAVHLELANSLNTESCLAALDRFVARRGKPSHIYSDQGSNFKASARHLNEVQVLLKNANPHLTKHLTEQNISWHFHPPGAPNFSGLVEAGVKSAKHHLTRILNGRALYQEEFNTLLCQVEAVLNSRPLGCVSTLPDDGFDYITPGHFLIGAPLIARPEIEIDDKPTSTLHRWKLVTKANQTFWKRWLSEYLHSQMQRVKWHRKFPNLQPGDPVFIIGENTPPRDWPLARIVKVFPGPDGIVRVAEVRSSHGLLTRPASKLCPLPVLH